MLVHHVICRVRVSTLGGRGCSLIHSMFIRQETGWDNTARNCILHYLLSATIGSLRHKFNFPPIFRVELQVSHLLLMRRGIFLFVQCFAAQFNLSRPQAERRRQSVYPGFSRITVFLSLLVLLTRADPSQNIDIFSPL